MGYEYRLKEKLVGDFPEKCQFWAELCKSIYTNFSLSHVPVVYRASTYVLSNRKSIVLLTILVDYSVAVTATTNTSWCYSTDIPGSSSNNS
jgi:hypothetical protein